MFRGSYLRLSPEHQQQLHALITGQFGAITGHSSQFLLTVQCLVFTEQIHHQAIVQTTDGTLVKGRVEQGHRQPHDRSHAGPRDDAHQDPKAATAVPSGTELHRVQATPGVEPPHPGAEEQAENEKHCSRAQQKSQPIGKVLVMVAWALEGDHGKDSLPSDGHEGHEAVANSGFLVHKEP